MRYPIEPGSFRIYCQQAGSNSTRTSSRRPIWMSRGKLSWDASPRLNCDSAEVFMRWVQAVASLSSRQIARCTHSSLIWGCDSYRTDFKSLVWQTCEQARIQREGRNPCRAWQKAFPVGARSRVKGVKEMLGIIAAVLIVLWLLGFLAFHVSSSVIHVLLVIGIVMLLAHFFRGRTATSWKRCMQEDVLCS